MVTTMLSTVATSAVVALLALSPAAASTLRSYTNGWVEGRATFFGRDAWSLHIGSCGFGFVCPNRWTNEGLKHGYDLVAISDQSPLFKGHSGAQCGQCLEVACRDAVLQDRYGERYARTSQCKDLQASVKVKIVDTCDCKYGPNSASNARWCCGDKPHLDVSQWALDKLVDDSQKWGVFAIRYRTIDCQASVAKEAKSIPIFPDPHAGDRGNTNCAAQGGGGLSTQARRTSRATVKTSHSSKYQYRLKLMTEAGARRSSRKFRQRLENYLNQFNGKMQKAFNKGYDNPMG